MYNNELYHYGVPGMKWGVRKSRQNNKSVSRKSKKSEDYLRSKQLKKKKLSEMSNAELKELNNRMQLESQYKNLKRQNISTGQKFIKDVSYEVAKNTVSEYARKYAKEGINYVSSNMSSREYMKRNGHS